jgi:hypothetical protein
MPLYPTHNPKASIFVLHFMLLAPWNLTKTILKDNFRSKMKIFGDGFFKAIKTYLWIGTSGK